VPNAATDRGEGISGTTLIAPDGSRLLFEIDAGADDQELLQAALATVRSVSSIALSRLHHPASAWWLGSFVERPRSTLAEQTPAEDFWAVRPAFEVSMAGHTSQHALIRSSLR